jgi:hypothetical protein
MEVVFRAKHIYDSFDRFIQSKEARVDANVMEKLAKG